MSSTMGSPVASRSQAASSSTSLSLKTSNLSSHRRQSPRPSVFRSHTATSSPTMASRGADPATELFQQKLRERKEELQRQGRLGDDGGHSSNVDGLSARYAAKSERRTTSSSGALGSRRASGQTMGLREQEEHSSKLEKQNFDLKLRIYHQDKRLDELLVELEKRDAEEKGTHRMIEEQQRELEHRDQSLRQAVDAILLMDNQIHRLKKMLQEQRGGDTQDLPELRATAETDGGKAFGLPAELLQGYAGAAEPSKLAAKISREVLAAGRASADPFLRAPSVLSRCTDDSRHAIDRLTMKSPAFSVLSEGDLESVYAWKERRQRGAAQGTQSEADISDDEQSETELILESDYLQPGQPEDEEEQACSERGMVIHSPDAYAAAEVQSPISSHHPESESAILDSDAESDWEPEEDGSVIHADDIGPPPPPHQRPQLARAHTTECPSIPCTSPTAPLTPYRTTNSSPAASVMPPRRPAQERTPPRRPRPLPPLPSAETAHTGFGTPRSAPPVPHRASSVEDSPSPAHPRPALHPPMALEAPGASGQRATLEPAPPARPTMRLVSDNASGSELHPSSAAPTRMDRPTRRAPAAVARRPRPLSLSAKEEQLLKYIEGIDGEFYIRGPREMMLAAGMFSPAYAAAAAHLPPTPPDTVAAASSAAGSRHDVSAGSARADGDVARHKGVTFGPARVLQARPASSAAAAATAAPGAAAASRRRVSALLKGRRMSWARGVGKVGGMGMRMRRASVAAETPAAEERKGEGWAGEEVAGAGRDWVRRDSDSSAGGEKDAVTGPKRRRWSFKARGPKRQTGVVL